MKPGLLALGLAGVMLGWGCAASAEVAAPPSATPAPVIVPPTSVAPPPPVVSARIIMLRVYVSSIGRSEQFYHDVLGANVVQRMGDEVRIMIFPGGAMPGIILIQSPEVATMHGSFVIQVPNLKETLDRALSHGGALKNTKFSQQMAGTPAQSSHFADPDGNLIEVLQIGSATAHQP